ncbi:uncharacterized protein J3R85_000575 [Psidium guajava]|nr:uncharacterized protein J3R85_000575 [Psidium guajava]
MADLLRVRKETLACVVEANTVNQREITIFIGSELIGLICLLILGKGNGKQGKGFVQ